MIALVTPHIDAWRKIANSPSASRLSIDRADLLPLFAEIDQLRAELSAAKRKAGES